MIKTRTVRAWLIGGHTDEELQSRTQSLARATHASRSVVRRPNVTWRHSIMNATEEQVSMRDGVETQTQQS